MAVDDKYKRQSAVGLALPHMVRGVFPNTNGVDDIERWSVTWMYNGIALGEVTILQLNQDISWDILKEFTQDVAWSIISTLAEKDVAWHIFPATVPYIANFLLGYARSNFEVAVANIPVVSSHSIKQPIKRNFTMQVPITKTFRITRVIDNVITPVYN